MSYKSIDQSDSQFLRDLLVVMDEWARSKEQDFKEKETTVPTKEVKLKVQLEAPKIEESPPEPFFDLSQMRL